MMDCDNCDISPDDCDPRSCKEDLIRKDPRYAKNVIIGMNLRDYFAGQALCGMVIKYAHKMDTEGVTKEGVAGQAYEVADAMLEARKGLS